MAAVLEPVDCIGDEVFGHAGAEGCTPVDTISVLSALRRAFCGLADDRGFVTAEGLKSLPDFDEGVAEALQRQVGPGPWQARELEELLQALFTGCGGDSARAQTKLGREASEQQLSGLRLLEDVVDSALYSEDTLACQALEEPESEEPSEAQALSNSLAEVQQTVMRRVVLPIVDGCSVVEEEEAALRELPAFVEEVLMVLRKTWNLAHLRGLRLKQAAHDLEDARAEARASRERAARADAARVIAENEAGQGEKAHELLEGMLPQLTIARQSIKAKESELADSRQRMDELERGHAQQAERIQQLEQALRREAASRRETERRVSEARAEAESEAAQLRSDLRRRLTATELALEEAHEEARMNEQRAEEAAHLRGDLRRRLAATELALEEAQGARIPEQRAEEPTDSQRGVELPGRRHCERPPAPAPKAVPCQREKAASGGGQGKESNVVVVNWMPPSAARQSPPATLSEELNDEAGAGAGSGGGAGGKPRPVKRCVVAEPVLPRPTLRHQVAEEVQKAKETFTEDLKSLGKQVQSFPEDIMSLGKLFAGLTKAPGAATSNQKHLPSRAGEGRGRQKPGFNRQPLGREGSEAGRNACFTSPAGRVDQRQSSSTFMVRPTSQAPTV